MLAMYSLEPPTREIGRIAGAQWRHQRLARKPPSRKLTCRRGLDRLLSGITGCIDIGDIVGNRSQCGLRSSQTSTTDTQQGCGHREPLN